MDATRDFPDAVRFFWSLYGVVLTRPPGVHTDGAAASLEAAKAEFRKCLGSLEGVGEDGRGRLVSSLRQSFSHRHKSQLPMLIGHDNGVGAQRFAGFDCIGPGVPRDL